MNVVSELAQQNNQELSLVQERCNLQKQEIQDKQIQINNLAARVQSLESELTIEQRKLALAKQDMVPINEVMVRDFF